MLNRDLLPFFRMWLAAPLRVAAVTPSSQSLARLITREIVADGSPVLELGPGTGVFTHALLGRGVAERDLILIEYEDAFARRLQQRFPQAQIHCMDASHLPQRPPLSAQPLGAVISGLPILSMPPDKIARILQGCFTHLRDDGALYQFTYGPRCPVPQRLLAELRLRADRLGGTLINFPPATVYRISRDVA